MKNLIVFSDFDKKISKTKDMFKFLKKFDAKNSLIIVDHKSKENIYKSARNLPNVKITDTNHFSLIDTLSNHNHKLVKEILNLSYNNQ